MEHELRDYQMNAVNDIRTAFKQGFYAPLLVMPTGSGKTHVFVYIAINAAIKGYRTMIIVHRSYLWQQVSFKLSELGVRHGIIAPGQTQTDDLIQIASIDTLIRRLHNVRRPNAIIFDEAHHVKGGNKWGKVAKYYVSKIIGFTATACRTDGSGLGINAGGFFDKLIYGPSYLDLTPRYLSPFRLFAPNIGVDLKNIPIRAGDYKKEELIHRFDKKKIYGDVPAHYMKICPDIPAIAFCVSVKHTEYVADEFNRNRISAAAVSGTTSEIKRKNLFRGLANGRYKVLCSCDLVSEGFDVPVCGAAILLRPTQSLTLYLQQCGRTTRIFDGKEYAYIIDHVGNSDWRKHGAPDLDREWSLDGIKKKKKCEEEEAKILTRTCPMCFIVHSPSPTCPNCGFKYIDFGILPRVDLKAELKEIQTEKQRKIQKQIKKKELLRSAKSLNELYNVAEQLHYKMGWAEIVWQSRQKKFENAKTLTELFVAARLIGFNPDRVRDEWKGRNK